MSMLEKCLSISETPAFPFVKISQKDLTNEKTTNEKLSVAARQGFFYLEIPEDCKSLIKNAVKNGNDFYKNPETRQLKLEGVSGFHDREKFQVESLYLERKYWSTEMNTELCALSEKMRVIAIDLLKKTLTSCGVPENQWNQGTGGVSEGSGQMHFTFNHYRADRPKPGLFEHCDFGQITVLYINKKGLQAKIQGQWQEIFPLCNELGEIDCFVINFGKALETFINDDSKLIAAPHRVPQLDEDRISLGTFGDNANSSTIWKRENGILIDTHMSYAEYLTNGFKKGYDE